MHGRAIIRGGGSPWGGKKTNNPSPLKRPASRKGTGGAFEAGTQADFVAGREDSVGDREGAGKRVGAAKGDELRSILALRDVLGCLARLGRMWRRLGGRARRTRETGRR